MNFCINFNAHVHAARIAGKAVSKVLYLALSQAEVVSLRVEPMVEPRRIELLTSAVRLQRSPS